MTRLEIDKAAKESKTEKFTQKIQRKVNTQNKNNKQMMQATRQTMVHIFKQCVVKQCQYVFFYLFNA